MLYRRFKTLGGAVSMLLICNGDILGISSIIRSILLKPRETILRDPSRKWNVVCLASFAASSFLHHRLFHDQENYFQNEFELLVRDGHPIVSKIGYMLSGLLVGLGVKVCVTEHS